MIYILPLKLSVVIRVALSRLSLRCRPSSTYCLNSGVAVFELLSVLQREE